MTVHFRIDPPGYFGLPDSGRTPIPFEEHTKIQFNVDPRTGSTSLTVAGRKDTTRRPGEAFTLSSGGPDFAIRWRDNIAKITVSANDQDEATTLAYKIIRHIIMLYSARNPSPVELTAFPFLIEMGGNFSTRNDFGGGTFILYDNRESAKGMLAASKEVSFVNEAASAALRYVAIGDDIGKARRESEIEEEHDDLLGVRFLQYWKALTRIIGDPTDGKKYGTRYRKLGFPADWITQVVRPLKARRDNFDVAHVTKDGSMSLVETEEVERCRQTAWAAIEAEIAESKALWLSTRGVAGGGASSGSK